MINPKTPINETTRLNALNQTCLVTDWHKDIFDNLTEIIKDVFNAPIVAVSLIGETRQFFKSIQGLNITETPRDISFCGHTICQKDSLIISDASIDPRFHDNPLVIKFPHIRFYAGVPIEYQYKNKSYAIGVLCLMDTKPRVLSNNERNLLKKFANQLQRTIEACVLNASNINNTSLENHNDVENLVNDLLRQNKLYKNLSEIDALTGLPNRRFLSNYMNRHWFDDDRHHVMSALLVDLDGFKHINDTYGHNVGDKVLIDASKEMSDILRYRDDTLIRLGGDEFIVILLDVGVDDALKVAGKLISAVTQVSTPDNKKLTASIGLVSIKNKELNIESVIEKADMAMYIAKKQGKSKVHYSAYTDI